MNFFACYCNYNRKVIMRINFTVFILAITILNAWASTYAQRISISFNKAPITNVLTEITKQTGFKAWYKDSHIKMAYPITVEIKNAGLTEVLDKCFENQPLTYKIVDRTIIIKEKPKALKDMVYSLIRRFTITGNVTNLKGQLMQGVEIRLAGSDLHTTTDNKGNFVIDIPSEKGILQFSHVGYEMLEIPVNEKANLIVVLKEKVGQLQEFNIVSTGYQQLPKERATGSFEIVDNKLLNRRVSTGILDRIENVVPGIQFDRTTYGPEPIRIRGSSTILAESSPLIIVDNFPFDGNVDDINPNDVESVTILKDAAAASIWGARAGNGVIVITTKKAKTEKPQIGIVSNLTFQSRPHLSTIRSIQSSDYIDLEKFLFSKGFYASDENALTNPPISPVVELLIAKREGKIDPTEADNQIEAYKSYNANSEIERNLYRPVVNQQYQMNISGQSPAINYYFSSGWDKSPGVLVGDLGNDRITIRSNNSFRLNSKLTAETSINYIQNKATTGSNPGVTLTAGGTKGLYPYARLIDDDGNPLSIVQNYRTSFVNQAMKKGLLDWNYSPIADIPKSNYNYDSKTFLLKGLIKYKVFQFLSAEVIYQYQNTSSTREQIDNKDSYYTRNLVNRYTQIEANTNKLTRPIPVGDIRILDNSFMRSNQGRGQLTYKEEIGFHEINAIAGIEVREVRTNSNGDQYYGYKPESNSSVTSMDYTRQYPQYNNNTSSAAIPNNKYISNGTIDHFWSYFSNLSYSYNQKYFISGSVRTDASNLFGVKTNQKGVPLWSAGIAWNMTKEPFFKSDLIPELKLRATYGIQGNFSRETAAITTAKFNTTSTGLLYATILNPPNESLRWEKVKMLNLGMDFTLKKNILRGSFEYYQKRASDLMGTAPIDGTVGLANEGGGSTFLGNIANMAGHGFDIRLVSQNINRKINWTTTALFSYVNIVVSKYFMPVSTFGQAYLTSSIYNPIEGRPLYSINSYKWAGLDPATGDPRGFLNGQVSTDYAKIFSETKLADMVYSGNRTPNFYGSLRNDFTYKWLSLSFNLSFKAGYFFQRSSIDYSNLFERWSGNADYAQRWKNPGDEAVTNVPSLTYPGSSNRDAFYKSSEVLIEKGDHIRLEDISLGYNFNTSRMPGLPFNTARLFMYANNLGILWRANKHGLDPNFLDIPTTGKTFSIGLNITL